MTREDKRAYNYARDRLANDGYPVYSDEYELVLAYKAGVEDAKNHPHWISVKDRKPKIKHSADNMKYSDTVIVTNGKYRTSANWTHNTWTGWYGWLTDGEEELKGITHWMPQPALPNGDKSSPVEKGGKE